jgi:hypothetical protein
MASKTTLNAKNLEALGAERLAQLLIEVSTGNAAAKRKLRLALAGAQSPREAAREIIKRLTSIARARGDAPQIVASSRCTLEITQVGLAFLDDAKARRRSHGCEEPSTNEHDPDRGLCLAEPEARHGPYPSAAREQSPRRCHHAWHEQEIRRGSG